MLKQIILSCFILMASCNVHALKQEPMVLPIASAVDGDTIKTKVNLPTPLNVVSIRIRGIDTPEKGKKAKCEKEAALAEKASASTTALIGKNTTMIVTNYQWDKYGGRIVGNVMINGKDVAQNLLDNGLAAPYTGKGSKPDWCK